DFAPVMMVNWEFFDNMDPAKTDELVERLLNDEEVVSSRGAVLTSWREAERVLAGFPDGRADEGPSAGPASLAGVEIARENNWSAPRPATPAAVAKEEAK
ncbi:MAG TPA: NADH-quinone oxidoreductase subunit E, partial [Arachnia sp.]|nr:NADH-quinone oxidoreductase subunit E [Arachnia sp.]